MAANKNASRVSPGRARASEKRRQALSLRKAGASFREIADTLGVSVARAYVYVSEEMAAVTGEAAEDLLALELQRLDTMQVALWAAVRRGDVLAIREARAIIETRSRLCGLLPAPGVTVNTTAPPLPEGAVLVIGGDKGSYIRGLRQARGRIACSYRGEWTA